MHKILVADNDATMVMVVEDALLQEGYAVIKARNSRDALEMAEFQLPDLILLNINLPDMDGINLCRRLRTQAQTREVPIILFADAASPYTAAEALNAGGDDYVRKPFTMQVLVARIRAHLRRVPPKLQRLPRVPQLRIIPERQAVMVNNRETSLTKVEFDLLLYLCRNARELCSIGDLLTNVWQYPEGIGDSALVRNHIRNLRNKLEDNPARPRIIQSRHGRGYMVKARVELLNGTPEPM